MLRRLSRALQYRAATGPVSGRAMGWPIATLALLAAAATPAGAMVFNQPILHYTLDASSISGGAYADFGSGGNNGVINGGGVVPVAGVVGDAASISGGGSNFISSGTPLLSTTDASQPYSFSFWMQSNGTSGAVISQYPGGADRFLITNNSQFSSGGELSWWHGNSGVRNETGVDISDNVFHHIAMVKDASQGLSIYVDGLLNQSNSSATDITPFATENLEIGRGNSSVHPFTGLVDDVAVFDQALDATFVRSVHSLATEPTLNYDVAEVLQLSNAFNQGTPEITIDGTDWVLVPDGSISGPVGTLTPSFVDGLPTLAINFGGGNGMAIATVPEPSTLMLFGMAIMPVVRRLRRRR